VPNGSLTTLVPLNATQRVYRPETIEYWAALAIGNAVQLAADPDFRALLARFNGRMMIGGLVSGPCHRLTRHLYVATLCHLFPAATFWLLGQASYPVLNGLGLLGLLDRVVTDGTAYLQDASNERISYVEEGLITIQSLEQTKAQKAKRRPRREFFFTFEELMAGALRSMLAAYAGLIAWPQLPGPIDLGDFEQLLRLKQAYRR
jgi:hypothetical protein